MLTLPSLTKHRCVNRQGRQHDCLRSEFLLLLEMRQHHRLSSTLIERVRPSMFLSIPHHIIDHLSETFPSVSYATTITTLSCAVCMGYLHDTQPFWILSTGLRWVHSWCSFIWVGQRKHFLEFFLFAFRRWFLSQPADSLFLDTPLA